LKEYIVVMTSVQGGVAVVGGEVGRIYALDPSTGVVTSYTYVGGGPGLGFGGSGNLEVGSIDMDSPDDITRWGLEAGAFAAAGPKGVCGSYSGTGPFGNGASGTAGGWSAGGGAGVSGIITYTWKTGQTDLSKLPDRVRKAFQLVLGQ
jgi:hypothetical protein